MKKLLLLSAVVASLPVFAEDAPDARPGTTAVAPVAKPTPASGYELRGFFGSGEKLNVSVRVPGSTESKWLQVGKKSGGLLIEKADSRAGTAVLLADGRRIALKLTGEAAPAVVAEAPKVAELSDADKARQARRERFRAMRENATPEQQAEFGRVLREKFEALRKNSPELMDPANRDNPEMRAKMGEAFRANMREAAEAAAKLPGKDGKVTPVPEDFNQLLIDEGKDMEARGARFRGRGARTEGAPATTATPPPATGDAPADK